MSNIRTTYIRFFKKDESHFTQDEMDHLFSISIRAYKEFGSYWVRINRKYRWEERCFDIQFGSSKRYHSDNLLEEKEIIAKYDIWEITADEGGFEDQLCCYVLDTKNDWVTTSDYEDCIYGFDKIILELDEDLPENLDAFKEHQTSGSSFELKETETYTACNSRSFKDLHEDSEFYGPKLGYDPTYQSDFFVLTGDGHFKKSKHQLVQKLFAYPHTWLPKWSIARLYWKGRLVHLVDHRNGEVKTFCADYWDNCLNPSYRNYINNRGVTKGSNVSLT